MEVGKNVEPPNWHDRDCPCVHPLDTLGCTCGPGPAVECTAACKK